MTLKKSSALAAGLILMAAMILPAPARAIELKIKLHGGYSYLMGGDLNSGTGGYMNMYKDFTTAMGFTVTGSFKPAHTGISYGGDLVLMLTPVLGIGVGGEYLKASESSRIDMVNGATSLIARSKVEATATPVNVSLYLCFSAGPAFRVNLYGGAGYYMAKANNSLHFEQGSDYVELVNSTKANKIGFHGGLGFELDLSSHIALFVEARGRYAKLSGFEGDLSASGTGGSSGGHGKLYYYETLGPFGNYFGIAMVQETEPHAEPDIRNIREARVDFSGGTAIGGIVFKF